MAEGHYKQETCNLHKKMKRLIFFLLTIVLLQQASAYTYLNIYIEENGIATFLGETSESLQLPENISIEQGIIKGSTQLLTNKQGELWNFSYTLKSADINLILPKNVILKSISNLNAEISIEKDQISIYSKDNIEITYTIKEDNNLSFPLLIPIIALLIIILSSTYYLIKINKKNYKGQDKLEIIKQILSKRENLILENLKKAGKIKSSYLRNLTQLPKASFSRYIHNLEKKFLIKRSGEGRNKFVELLER